VTRVGTRTIAPLQYRRLGLSERKRRKLKERLRGSTVPSPCWASMRKRKRALVPAPRARSPLDDNAGFLGHEAIVGANIAPKGLDLPVQGRSF